MIIELIKNKEPEWRCPCTGNDFGIDIRSIGLCISIDNKQISHYNNIGSELAMQFHFTYNYWENGTRTGENPQVCIKCGNNPYRIVKNPLREYMD